MPEHGIMLSRIGIAIGIALIFSFGFFWLFKWIPGIKRWILTHVTLLLWMSVGIFCALYWQLGIMRHNAIKTSIADIGLFSNALWSTLHGHFLETWISNGSLFAFRFNPAFALLSIIYAPFPFPEWLIGIQAIITCSGALALYSISRQFDISKGMGLIFALVWLLATPIRGALLFDIHEVTLISALVLWLLLLIQKQHLIWVLMMVLLLLGLKEDAAVYLACLGLLLVLGFERKREGWLLLILSVAYFFIVQLWLWSAVTENHLNMMMLRFPQLYTKGGSIWQNLIANPLCVIEPLLNWNRLWGLLMLFLPVSLLCFFKKSWLALIPAVLLFLSINYFDYYFYSNYYAAPVFALVMIAAIIGWHKLEKNNSVLRRFLPYTFIPFSITLAFAMPDQVVFDQLHPSAYAPHPELAALKAQCNATPSSASVSSDRDVGSHLTERLVLSRFPGNRLSERLFVSNGMLFHPRLILAIADLDYGIIEPNPCFWFLSKGEGEDARDAFMGRMAWVEAEGCDLPAWLPCDDKMASGGRSMHLPSTLVWGKRISYSPHLLLPPGDYSYIVVIRGKKQSARPNRNSFELTVCFQGKDKTGEELAYQMIKADSYNHNEFHEEKINFHVPNWGETYLRLEFSKIGDVWIDGIGLIGLPASFDDYYKQVFPVTTEISNTEQVKKSNDTLLSCDLPASLKTGYYLVYYQVQSNQKHRFNLEWADWELVKASGERTVLRPVVVNHNPGWGNDCNIESSVLRLVSEAKLELVLRPDAPNGVDVGKIWITPAIVVPN